jgi:hypothetical protein
MNCTHHDHTMAWFISNSGDNIYTVVGAAVAHLLFLSIPLLWSWLHPVFRDYVGVGSLGRRSVQVGGVGFWGLGVVRKQGAGQNWNCDVLLLMAWPRLCGVHWQRRMDEVGKR